jgi:hypothetical protein
MKKLLYACTAVVMALTTATALAADFTGTWTGEMAGGNGGFQISFTFKQDGAKLTGTVQGPQGDPITISDGKIDGDKISFSVSFNGMTITHEGTINAAGDEIKLTTKSSDGQFPGGEMTLKRAKAASPAAN